ncbi:uncharacterized protein B0T23DRAFT_308751 [Neurospora hispaniola]|uniref:Uncharacterized protein n=1 Tax=Neurospora hispaniola TaxID=588809 RepID=A0AAJ0IHD1_9PEZI|nr:hypothetical protein B0T23DRAFT_308751 [Neurospora hispaniola]
MTAGHVFNIMAHIWALSKVRPVRGQVLFQLNNNGEKDINSRTTENLCSDRLISAHKNLDGQFCQLHFSTSPTHDNLLLLVEKTRVNRAAICRYWKWMVKSAGTYTTSQLSSRSESSQTGRRLWLGKSRNRSAWYSGNWFAVLGATRRFRPGKGRDRGAGDRRDRSTDLAASRRLRLGKRWNGSAGNGRDGLPEGGAGDHVERRRLIRPLLVVLIDMPTSHERNWKRWEHEDGANMRARAKQRLGSDC